MSSNELSARDAGYALTVGELATVDCTFPPETPASHIADAFERHPELPGILVADTGDRTVLISRERFLERLSQPFGLELFMRRPIRTLAATISDETLQITAAMGIDEAAHAALSRPAALVYEPLVVLDGERRSILDIHTLLLAQSQLLLVANRMIQEQKQTAEQANAAKSRFLANMSHEIRTPLTSILGFAEQLQFSDLNPGEFQDSVQAIIRNGKHLLELINEILDLSKIEAGHMQIEEMRCSLPQLCAHVFSVISVRAEAKKLPLVLTYATPIPETIVTDPTRLRQILINLLGNSIKFTAAGRVELRVSLVHADNTGQIRFEVVDTGIGMTAEQMQNLFQPFVQADSSTTRRFGGTGLGLTISRHLARMLGGDISVRSIPDLGSVFTATVSAGDLDDVPLVRHPHEAVVDADHRPIDLDHVRLPCRILLVEDSPDNQLLISALLRKLGAEVAIAGNGQLAVDAALAGVRDERPYDVVLMDMLMPVMDGYTATRVLRRQGYDRPIIALTANAMSGDAAECLQAGCDDYACKPIDRKQLVSQILAVCHRGSLSEGSITEPAPAPATDEPALLDRNVALAAVDGDYELLREISQMFLDLAPQWIAESEAAWQAGNWESLRRASHSLKSSAANLGAQPVSAAALAIEIRAAARDGLDLDDLLLDLKRQLAALLPEIEQLASQSPPD